MQKKDLKVQKIKQEMDKEVVFKPTTNENLRRQAVKEKKRILQLYQKQTLQKQLDMDAMFEAA